MSTHAESVPEKSKSYSLWAIPVWSVITATIYAFFPSGIGISFFWIMFFGPVLTFAVEAVIRKQRYGKIFLMIVVGAALISLILGFGA